MNPIYAFLVMLALVTVTTTVWYFTTPLGSMSINISSDIINDTAHLDATEQSRVSQFWGLLNLCLKFWGPILDLVYVGWFLIFGTRGDVESERRRAGIYY